MKKNIIVSITIAIITIIAASFSAGAEFCAAPEDAIVESAYLGTPQWRPEMEACELLNITTVRTPDYGMHDELVFDEFRLVRTYGSWAVDLAKRETVQAIWGVPMTSQEVMELKETLPYYYLDLVWSGREIDMDLRGICRILDDLYRIQESPGFLREESRISDLLVQEIWRQIYEVELMVDFRDKIGACYYALIIGGEPVYPDTYPVDVPVWDGVYDVDDFIINNFGYGYHPVGVDEMASYYSTSEVVITPTPDRREALPPTRELIDPIPEEQLSEEENLSEEEGLVEDGFVGLDIEAAEEDLGFIS